METQLNVENYGCDSNANLNETIMENNYCEKNIDTILERGTVPGAQSTSLDSQLIRQFSNLSSSSPFNFTFHNINVNDNEEKNEEIINYADNDENPIGERMVLGCNSNAFYGPLKNVTKLKNVEKTDDIPHYIDNTQSIEQRMVLGCNVSTTFSGSRKNVQNIKDSKLDKQYSVDALYNQNKNEPSLEGRMVVGETSDVGQIMNRSIRDERQHMHLIDDDKSRRNTSSKEPVTNRYDKNRKISPYDSIRRDRRKIESDDEDYDETVERMYDNSPDREIRCYPRRFDKKLGRDCESSFTQSQDESYYDDDDDDYGSYREPRSYYNRRSHRETGYRHYNYDSYFRDDRSYRSRKPVYYNNRFDDEPYYREGGRNSRPSSRSGSEYRRDVTDYTNPRYYSRPQYYEYLDHRRINNGLRMHKADSDYWFKVRELEPQKYMNWFKEMFPKEYADWYIKYVRVHNINSYQADRRGSGHSGQSSVNNDSNSLSEKLLDVKEQSLLRPTESDTISSIQKGRSSPLKFVSPHIKGNFEEKGVFNSLGQLLVINPCSPQDNESATIDICQVLPPQDDPDLFEFMKFPGPFIVGETHVNTVSDFIKHHANTSTSLSEKLLYMLIDLIIKLRGVTDGIAISELLMSSYQDSKKFHKNHLKEESIASAEFPYPSESEIIDRYTELLLQGNKNAALDWAVNNKLWGHAFFLASKMGNKHYSNILAKFDTSIPTNNPLKTLYQLYSNQIPQAATACADEKWGDWRPHLAMILSNPTIGNDLDKTAIITLGDSLSSKNVFASHFCYLAAQADFDFPNSPTYKYCLLSLNSSENFEINTCNHAILLTQMYEFAKRLQNKDFTIPTLYPYKYLLATRLIDYGKSNVALQYLESIALDLIRDYSSQYESLARNILNLSEQIKYSDTKPFITDLLSEKQWITNLRDIISCNTSADQQIQFKVQNNEVLNKDLARTDHSHSIQNFVQPFSDSLSAVQKSSPQQLPTLNSFQQYSSPIQLHKLNQDDSLTGFSKSAQHTDTQRPLMWDNKPPINSNTNSFEKYKLYNPSENIESNSSQLEFDYNKQERIEPDNNNSYSSWDQPQLPNSVTLHSRSNYFEESNKTEKGNNYKPSQTQVYKEEVQTSQSNNTESETKKKKSENENTWFSSIFGKLKKNQINLPDDKNKSIVWSAEKKRWIDLNSPNDDDTINIKPPPTTSELTKTQVPLQYDEPNQTVSVPHAESLSIPNQNIQNKPALMNSNNMYKLPKGKTMKSNYVDVFSSITVNSPPPVQFPNATKDVFSNNQNQVPPNYNLLIPSSSNIDNKSTPMPFEF